MAILTKKRIMLSTRFCKDGRERSLVRVQAPEGGPAGHYWSGTAWGASSRADIGQKQILLPEETCLPKEAGDEMAAHTAG
jgi:hypothetical protein